ncbi:MAG TPA: ribosome recycling factor [Firmicutes bacterium]|nr:ribosome recycling factor [Bacillota bacterium]HCM17622.1 ribosome recycling factor [Bacillota bacterium]
MIKDVLTESEQRMKGVIEATKRDFTAVRTGRANPGILDRVVVDYYGTPTPLNQMANISSPDPRMLLIQPWDKSQIAAVEKAILKADLGLNPSNDGSAVRLSIPQLTEERRKELVKLVRKETEEKRVAVRNIRRDANEAIKNLEKGSANDISEDDAKKGLDDVQKLTDQYIKTIDSLLETKEKEIMEI